MVVGAAVECAGDVTGDLIVDVNDLLRFRARTMPPPSWLTSYFGRVRPDMLRKKGGDAPIARRFFFFFLPCLSLCVCVLQ